MRAVLVVLVAAVFESAVLVSAVPEPGPSTSPGSTAGASASPIGEDGTITEIRFYGCTAHFGYLPLENEDATSLAPPGFGTQPFPGGAFAVSTAYSQHCTRIETNTGHVFADYTETMHLMRLAPPPEHEAPGVHNLPLRIMTNDPVLAQVYRDWGWHDQLSVGDVTVETTAPAGQGLHGTTLGTAADWGMILTVSAAPTTGPWDGTTIRFYGRDGTGNVSTVSEFTILPATVWPAATTGGRSTFAYTHGAATTQPGSVGLGQIFRWDPEALTQTLTLRTP